MNTLDFITDEELVLMQYLVLNDIPEEMPYLIGLDRIERGFKK